MELKKKLALIAAGSLISAAGLYAVTTSASAAPSSAPALTLPTGGVEAPVVGDTDNLQEGDQNATDNTTEVATEGVSDGVDVGPDTNASEPGHQDAAGADEATEASDVTEAATK